MDDSNHLVIKFCTIFIDYIHHSSSLFRISNKTIENLRYNHQTSNDYDLWFRLLYDLENEGIRFHKIN